MSPRGGHRYLAPAQRQTSFVFRGKRYRYNRIAHHNQTATCVEIPIAFAFLNRWLRPRARICEVGNMLSHFESHLSDLCGLHRRKIFDRREGGPGVDPRELLELPPRPRFDLVVSLAKVEHLGQLEQLDSNEQLSRPAQGRREAPLEAIARMYDLLVDGGRALVSAPFGRLCDGGWFVQFSGEYLDRLTTVYGIPASALRIRYLKRVTMEPHLRNPYQIWQQVDRHTAARSSHDHPYPYANAVAILELCKRGPRRPATGPSAAPALVYQPAPVVGNVLGRGVTLSGPLRPDGCLTPAPSGALLELRRSVAAGVARLSLEVQGRGRVPLELELAELSDRGERALLPPVRVPDDGRLRQQVTVGSRAALRLRLAVRGGSPAAAAERAGGIRVSRLEVRPVP
jgi:hypothetical protein